MFLSLLITFASQSLYSDVHDPNGEKPYFIMFSSKRCPHCVTAEPYFKKVAKSLESIAISKKVDASSEKRLASELRITGVPSFVCFYKGVADKYNGPINEKNMFNFVLEQLGRDIPLITELPQESRDNIVVYFSRRFKPTSTISYASYLLSKKVKFAMVNNNKLIKELGVKKVPSYYFFKNGEMEMYQGSSNTMQFIMAICDYYNISMDPVSHNSDL